MALTKHNRPRASRNRFCRSQQALLIASRHQRDPGHHESALSARFIKRRCFALPGWIRLDGFLGEHGIREDSVVGRPRFEELKVALSQVPNRCHIRTMKTVTLSQAKTKLQALLRFLLTGGW